MKSSEELQLQDLVPTEEGQCSTCLSPWSSDLDLSVHFTECVVYFPGSTVKCKGNIIFCKCLINVSTRVVHTELDASHSL